MPHFPLILTEIKHCKLQESTVAWKIIKKTDQLNLKHYYKSEKILYPASEDLIKRMLCETQCKYNMYAMKQKLDIVHVFG